MAAKPTNKWKSVSKSVVGVLATKIATENPDKQFDNLKAFLERTKKQMFELRNYEGAREILEERILKARAIVITFENRKTQLDNVLEIVQQNEQNDTLKNEWNSYEEQMRNVVKELESVLEKWNEVDDLIEKIHHLLDQLETRRESCCTLDSAIDITSRLQNLKDEHFKTCLSSLQKLKHVSDDLKEICKTDVATDAIQELEQKMIEKEREFNETVTALQCRVDKEKEYDRLKDKFRRELDNGLEILKNIRNEECDTTELQTCLDLVKKLKGTKMKLEKDMIELNEQTKLLLIERYSSDFERIKQIWLTFCDEIESCQKTLETQTNESRKVLYLLNSAKREISKQEKELKDLDSFVVNNKAQLVEKLERIKISLQRLNDVYVTMEKFSHQWEKLKKNGLSDVSVEKSLQEASEHLNALQYDFQSLQEKNDELLNTVERIDEDCNVVKRNINDISSYLDRVRISEEDTNSDIQAKLSKLDQNLWSPCWDLIENVESLTENLPETFESRSVADKLKIRLTEIDEEFASVRNRLSDALLLLDKFNELYNRVTVTMNANEKLLPNLKRLTSFDEKLKALNDCKSVEEKMKLINSDELTQISNIKTTLALNLCNKPAKTAKNKWQDLMQAFLESKTKLSQEILKEQSRINRLAEFREWISSTKDSIEQFVNTVQFDSFEDVEMSRNNLNELHINLKDKQEELNEMEADAERDDIDQQLSSMSKQVGNKLESVTIISNKWSEFDRRMESLTSWFNARIDKFNETKTSNNLKNTSFVLKEIQRDLNGRESKINELNCDAQALSEMTNSYCVLQQTCSLINRKSNFRDEIETDIQCVEKWLFIKNQLKYLNQQISSVCEKISSLVVSLDDLEDHSSLVEEIQTKLTQFDEDLNKIKKCDDDHDCSSWPEELSSEFSNIERSFAKLQNEIEAKQLEIQRIVDAENERRLLSVAKSHECTPAVYETVDELPTLANDYEVHCVGNGRRTSLKLNKFGKLRNRTNSGTFKRRRSSKSLLMTARKKSQSEVIDDASSTCSSSIEPIVEVAEQGDDNNNLWERVRELAVQVRMIDLTKLLASTALKVLLGHLADARRLWLAHGDFDFYNFNEIALHQTIQFVQLDILNAIEECCRLIDASSVVDNIISHID